jgi:hypothetical protein
MAASDEILCRRPNLPSAEGSTTISRWFMRTPLAPAQRSNQSIVAGRG